MSCTRVIDFWHEGKNLQWYSMTMQYNPNLVPIGHGFGFIVLMEEIEDW